MDGVTGIGTSTWLGEGRKNQSKSGFSAAWAEIAAGNDSVANTSGASSQPPVRPSMLVALQDVRLNQPSADEEEEGKAGDVPQAQGIFATADEEAGERTVIDEIKEKGLAEWAHEQWLERIREKARQTALADLGLTEDDVASMSPEMQARIEEMIKQVVEEAVRQATEKAVGDNGEKQTGEAKVLSPIITGG